MSVLHRALPTSNSGLVICCFIIGCQCVYFTGEGRLNMVEAEGCLVPPVDTLVRGFDFYLPSGFPLVPQIIFLIELSHHGKVGFRRVSGAEVFAFEDFGQQHR